MRATLFAVAAACLLPACRSTEVRGPEGTSIRATTPSAVTIRRGESIPLEVAIDRENFAGPVTVSIAKLPRGVDVDRKSMRVETTSATFVLKAGRDADLVRNQAVTVSIEGLNGRKATQYVDLSVIDY